MDRCQPVVAETASSAQRRAAVRSPRASAVWATVDVHRRDGRLTAQLLPGHLAGIRRCRSIAGGQGWPTPTPRSGALDEPAELGGGLDGGAGRGPGRARITLVGQRVALTEQAVHPPQHVVRCLRVGHQLAELRGGSDQVAPHHLCPTQAKAARTGAVPVADRVGKVASFLAGRAPRDRITGQKRPICLPAQDLAEP